MSYKTYENGKIIEKTRSLVSRDNYKTLDCLEYSQSKKINKFFDSYHFVKGVEKR